MLDDIINNYKKRKNKLEDKITKHGRTWKQIAMDFAIDAKKMLEEHPNGFAIHGKDLRPVIADPDNKYLRRQLKNNGVRITKATNKDIYRIEKYDILEEKVKQNENSSIF